MYICISKLSLSVPVYVHFICHDKQQLYRVSQICLKLIGEGLWVTLYILVVGWSPTCKQYSKN